MHDTPGAQAAIRRGELGHSIVNDEYWAAVYRANFYRWSATRNFPMHGGDPYTGQPMERIYGAREVGRLCDIVQARYWLNRAAELRRRYSSVSHSIPGPVPGVPTRTLTPAP